MSATDIDQGPGKSRFDGFIWTSNLIFEKQFLILFFNIYREFSKIPAKKNLQILENCNYAVELGRKLNFVLVGIQGDDIKTGNKTLTLGKAIYNRLNDMSTH